jgi:hypothetical protein
MSSSSGTIWSYEEEKSFENAIAMHWNEKEEENSNEQWEKIASCVPNKSIEEVKQHYQLLVDDVSAIEAGHVSFPNYANELETTTNSSNKDSSKSSTSSDKRSSSCNFGSGFSGLGHESTTHHSSGKGGLSRSSSEQERRKGIPWTEEEHRYYYLITFTTLPSYNCPSPHRSIYLSVFLSVCLLLRLPVCTNIFQ